MPEDSALEANTAMTVKMNCHNPTAGRPYSFEVQDHFTM